MKTLIIADVHLKVSPDGEETLREFTAFLRDINSMEVDRLILLGDLFDFWFEYKHVIFSGYFEILRALADLRDDGTELHLVCGNHDFWAGRFLIEMGIHVLPDEMRCELGDKRALFMHGDGLNENDKIYRIYKRIACSWFGTRVFRALHPDWAMALAQRVSHKSRTLLNPSNPADGNEVSVIRNFASDALARGDADVVMCGHTHFPVEETCPTPTGEGLYINVGDWQKSRTYIEWEGDSFARKTYESSEQEGASAPHG